MFQDGAIYIEYPGDKWRAFFFAFQSQTFKTDDQGNAMGSEPEEPKTKKKKQTAKKHKKKGGK